MINNNLMKNFILAISDRIINSSLLVELKFETNGYKDIIYVYIDDIEVGEIYENPEDKSPTTLCYFLPNILFFDFIDNKPINDFVKVTQKLSMALDDVFDPHNPEKPQDRKLSDFGFKIHGANVSHRFEFDNKKVFFNENLSITFKVIKQDGIVCIIDNFKTSIRYNNLVDYTLLPTENIKDLNYNMDMIISKNNENYILTHEYQDYRPSIVFDADNIPDFEEFISFVVNYTLMMKHNIELPSMTEFNENKERYKNLIEMALIC